MNTPASFDQILLKIGPRDESILSVVRREPSEWTVRYADTDVQVALTEATGRLSFLCALSQVREEDRLRLYALFLRYNLLVGETGGVLFALNEDTPVLMLEWGEATLDTDRFEIILRNFTAKARLWEQTILERPQTAPSPSDLDHAFSIRI